MSVIDSSFAIDPDFFVDFSSCKIAVGYLFLSDESLKIIDGDVTIMACNRRSNNIKKGQRSIPSDPGFTSNLAFFHKGWV
jgi:hypothetical protein